MACLAEEREQAEAESKSGRRMMGSSSPPSSSSRLRSPESRGVLALSPLLLPLLLLPAPAAPDAAKKATNRCPLRPPSRIVRPPLVLGHRGASFHLPEHTLPSYRLALELGADYIEPDLVPCQDGTLVAVHSADLNITSNVHTYNNGEFRGRARRSEHSGEWGYYVQDFTWKEVQKLRVRQRLSEGGARYSSHDYAFGIPSFGQIVDLLHDWNTQVLPQIGRPGKTGGVPGLYAELKLSSFFLADANMSIADLFLDELAAHPKASELLFDHVTLCDHLSYAEYRVPPLVVQSFNGEDLEYLRNKFKERWKEFVEEDALLSSGVVNSSLEELDEIDHPWIPPLVLLTSHDSCDSETFWFDVAKLPISGIGPDKRCLLPSAKDVANNNTSAIAHAKHMAKEWVAKAHSERLAVHPWTVRLEVDGVLHAGGVPEMFRSAEEELKFYYCELNVDGIFSENIALAREVGAEGCDDYLAVEKPPRVGHSPYCERGGGELGWLRGLFFLTMGGSAGSALACVISAARQKRGSAGKHVQLPEINDATEENGDAIIT